MSYNNGFLVEMIFIRISEGSRHEIDQSRCFHSVSNIAPDGARFLCTCLSHRTDEHADAGAGANDYANSYLDADA
jgi:hypothetical protein